MSTSEYGSIDPGGELPISAAELATLANQMYAASFRPGFDSPPQAVPVAPRGSMPDVTAVTSAGRSGAGLTVQRPSGPDWWGCSPADQRVSRWRPADCRWRG